MREEVFYEISVDTTKKVVHAVIAIIERIDHELNGLFGRVPFDSDAQPTTPTSVCPSPDRMGCVGRRFLIVPRGRHARRNHCSAITSRRSRRHPPLALESARRARHL